MTAHNPQLDKERLLQLSSEVSRIATTLARLSSETEMFTADEKSRDNGPLPEISPKSVAALMRVRRVRATYFDQELFADPAWDMMLELFHAELTHRRVPVSNLCSAAAVPATTALRWLKTLVEKGLVVRRDDPLDGRRVYVELQPQTSDALKRYFGAIADAGL
ncbi:MAG TPA: winged helix DNA-binding protein [Sphingomicrobium sp.]|nr:winged helix DNA-binding protein [Sphingomicrobium sp.]